jgi:hypothetical protein
MNKLSISADSIPIEEKVETDRSQSIPKTSGRPTDPRELVKISIILSDQQVYWLDRLAADIRLNTKKALSRAEIIRAILLAVEQSGIDLSYKRSEEEIVKAIQEKFK